MKFLPKIVFFSFFSFLFIFSGGGGCLSSSNPGGGSIGGPDVASAPGQATGAGSTGESGDNAQAVQMTPSSPVGIVAPDVDPGGDNLLEVRGSIEGICRAGKNSKKVHIQGWFYWYRNAGDWRGHQEWVDPQPLTSCKARVVFPQEDGLHFKDVQCGSKSGSVPGLAIKGLGPIRNYFEMTLTTTALTDSTDSTYPIGAAYLSDGRVIRVVLEGKNYQFPPTSDDSCGDDSCLQVGVRGVRPVIEYTGFENLPDCVQPELGKAVSREN